MSLVHRVYTTVTKFGMIKPGEKILVGVSGGPDSVALLHILIKLGEQLGISLHVAHLNHMFRGEDAERDALMVVELARHLGVPYTVSSFDVPGYRRARGMSAQEAAREVRYRFFEEEAAKAGAAKIALGHHADDQAETILIKFLRGTGPSGLKGILPVRDGYYIRPLLEVRRRDIERYCEENNLPTAQDVSNLKPVYTRNRIRLELIPQLEKKYNANLVPALVRLGHIIRDEDVYLEEQTALVFGQISVGQGDNGVKLETQGILEQAPALQRRVVRCAWRKVTGTSLNLSYEQVESVLELIKGGATGDKVVLPQGVCASRGFNYIEICMDVEPAPIPPYCYPLAVPGKTYIPELEIYLHADLLTVEEAPNPRELQADEAVLDAECLKEQLVVRRRREGEVFAPLGLGGKMKLKKFLNQVKVPAQKRDRIPLVVSGEDIIWVAGIRPGEPWKLTPNTRKCLWLKIIRSD